MQEKFKTTLLATLAVNIWRRHLTPSVWALLVSDCPRRACSAMRQQACLLSYRQGDARLECTRLPRGVDCFVVSGFGSTLSIPVPVSD